MEFLMTDKSRAGPGAEPSAKACAALWGPDTAWRIWIGSLATIIAMLSVLFLLSPAFAQSHQHSVGATDTAQAQSTPAPAATKAAVVEILNV